MDDHLELEAEKKFQDHLQLSGYRYEDSFIQTYMAYEACIVDAIIEMETSVKQDNFERAFRYKKLLSIFIRRHAKWCYDTDFKQI